MRDEDVTEDFRSQLRDAVEEAAARDANWEAFHIRLGAAVAGRLADLRRRTSGGYRATAAAGAAWWDYAAGAALAAVPLGLAAALLLVTYLRSGTSGANDPPPVIARVAIASASADSARVAFESVLTGVESPRAAMATLIPVPAAAFIAESAGRTAR